MDLETYLARPDAPSQSELARRAGIPRTTLRGILDGKRPLLETALAIRDATGGLVTLEALTEDL